MRGNLNAPEFKKALIGKWTAAYTYESRRNIVQLDLGPDGTAKLVTTCEGRKTEQVGRYEVDFERPPDPGMTTFARIVIAVPESDPVVLSRVNFGRHNGVMWDRGPFLRIDREPWGVLEIVD